MLRSLFAGVTGLANHQLKLDVIGNNIANINTLGFKASRVTFREMLTQTIRGASRPGDGTGGTNPQQIGLGSSVGSVDTDFSQGNMQITGIMTDMAIEGEGFFVLSDGFNQYYTRGGAFSIDGAGNMVNPGNGFKLQGVQADSYGNIEQGQGLQDIVIPTSLIVPARATSDIELRGNLLSNANPQATILRTSGSFFAAADGTDSLFNMFTGTGVNAGVPEGETVIIDASIAGAGSTRVTLDVTSTSTLQELVDEINNALSSLDAAASASLNDDGEIMIHAGGANIDNLDIFVEGTHTFNNSFDRNFSLASGSPDATVNTTFLTYAEDSDLLSEIYYNGSLLNIEGDLNISGDINGTGIVPADFNYDPMTSSFADLAANINAAFGITEGSVEINSMGRMVVTGDTGQVYEINSVHIDNADGTPVGGFSFDTVQSASDGDSYSVVSMIYDSLGNTHSLSVNFTKIPYENIWNWTAEIDGIAVITDGGSGQARFSEDGLLSSFTTNGGSGSIEIDFNNGSDLTSIDLNPGEIGSTSALSQYNADFSVRMNDVDGMGMGTLQTISIDRNGVVNGQFSNGTNRDLAQIAMADFNNPSGLNRVGENMFIFSPNSGVANFVFAGTNARGMITPGELEMSNVDLAGEFTEMIIAQRGFQANARIISVGDQMLTELVNLKK